MKVSSALSLPLVATYVAICLLSSIADASFVCPMDAEAILTCLKASAMEPQACSSCLDTAEERAGNRSQIELCEAWNTNFCTAIEVCRATCIGLDNHPCEDEFDAFKACAPQAISDLTLTQCPFTECQGAVSVSSTTTSSSSSSRMRGSLWSMAAVGLGALVIVTS